MDLFGNGTRLNSLNMAEHLLNVADETDFTRFAEVPVEFERIIAFPGHSFGIVELFATALSHDVKLHRHQSVEIEMKAIEKSSSWYFRQ